MNKALLLLSLLLPLSAFAEDYTVYKELSLKTEAGEIVLTVQDCPVVNQQGFAYYAYATDGAVKHNGCWQLDHDLVSMIFYEDEVTLIATFKQHLFTPKPNL